MTTPANAKRKRSREPEPRPAETSHNVIDVEMHRMLRRRLHLTSADIGEIDLALAVECGLLTKPKNW